VETELVRSGMLWLGPADRRRIEEYYDRAVGYVDRHVGRLFAGLRERAGRRPLVAALTTDHGEELWDHGHYEHGHDYYREVTRAPLVFWGPGRIPEGRSAAELTGIVDVAPTLLALAGLEPPASASPDHGRSLVGAWTGAPAQAPPPRFSEGNLYELPAVLVEEGSWRFLLRANGVEELYHVELDPQERRNMALDEPERVGLYREMLKPRLAAFLGDARAAGPIEISPEILQSLRALGYVR
jgi:arylsulfatase A-like enzyme